MTLWPFKRQFLLVSIVWQWPPADLPSSTVWLDLQDCRRSVEGHFSEPRSGNLCSDMTNENCAIIEGLRPEAGVRQPVAMSFKPMGSSSSRPPVTCVCHAASKCRESNDLCFFPPLLLFFFSQTSSLAQFTMQFHKHQHKHKAGATKSCGWGLLDANEKDLCETVCAWEHLAKEGDVQAW